jgi:hypothetical protein
MKSKTSIAVAVLVLSCTAAFGQTSVKLGFLDHDKQTQYCDYEQLTVEKGGMVVTGTHYPTVSGSTTCFTNGVTGTITGLVANFPASSGMLVTGKVATFADDTEDALGGFQGACGCTYYYVSRLRASTPEEIQNDVYGYAVYDNFGGTASLLDFGFTTEQLGNNNENAEATYDSNL